MSAQATASGVFELVDKASGTLDKIEKNAVSANKALDGTGNSLEHIGGSKIQQGLVKTNKAIDGIGNSADRTAKKIEKVSAAIALVEAERKKASGKNLDIDTAKAEAKLRLLRAELRKLTNEEARRDIQKMGVEIGGLTSALVGKGVGGGVGGGGGGGGGLRGGLAGGFFAAGGRAAFMTAALVAASPAVVALTGAVSALVGSLGAAVGGAGVLGAGALGGFAVGLAAIISVAKPAINTLKELKKAQDDYNKAVQQYGSRSAQAVAARQQFNQMRHQNPGAGAVLQNSQVLSSRWRRQSAPARGQFFGIMNSGLRTGNALLPTFGATTNSFMASTGNAVDDFLRPFEGAEWRGIIRDMGSMASRSIGPFARSLGNVALAIGRIGRAVDDRVINGFNAMERWTDRMADNAGRSQGTMDRWIDQLKSWMGLLGAAGKLAMAFFGAGSERGQSQVDAMTSKLDQWTAWIERNPAKIDDFFRRTIDSTGKLAGALGEVVSELGRLADALLPVLNLVSNVTNTIGDVGPGGGLLGPLAGLGIYSMLRGRASGRGGGGRGGGFLGGLLGAGAAGRGAGGGVGAMRTTFGAMRVAGVGAGSAAGSTAAYYGLRGAGVVARRFAPILGVLAAYDFLRTPGDLGERAQNVAHGILPLIPAAQTRVDVRNKAQQEAMDRLAGGMSTRALRGEVHNLGAALAEKSGAQMVWDPDTHSYVRKDTGGLEGKDRLAAESKLKIYKGELRLRVKMERAQKVGDAADDIFKAFDIRLGRKGNHWGDARSGLFKDIRHDLKALGPAGKKDLLAATAQWAEGMSHGTKAQRKTAKETADFIQAQFGRMGKFVQVVNGQILTGSSKEWSNIRDALGGRAEQARQQVSKAFTEMQQTAIGSLIAMGFSRGQATKIVRGLEKGGEAGRQANVGIAQAQRGVTTGQARVEGSFGGNITAPRTGDAWGVDSHESAGATRNARPSNSLMGASPNLSAYATMGNSYGLHVTSGLRPGAITSAGNTSYHSTGNAIDMAGAPQAMMAYALALANSPQASQIEELIYSPLGFSIKNGKRVPAYAVSEHFDHVHVADTGPGGAIGGGPGTPLMGGIQLPRMKEKGGPLEIAMARARNAIASGMEKKINDSIGATLGGMGGFQGNSLAALWVAAGGPPQVANLMSQIAMAESAGNPNAYNPSGASGLWQILGQPFKGNVFDPMTNARMAVWKYQHQGLKAWEAYTNGSYQRFAATGDGPGRIGGGRVRRRSDGNVSISIGKIEYKNEGDIEEAIEKELARVGRRLQRDLWEDELS